MLVKPSGAFGSHTAPSPKRTASPLSTEQLSIPAVGRGRRENLPLKHTRVKGKESVQWVGAGLHRVSTSCTSNNREHLAIVPLHDGVAEHKLVFTVGHITEQMKHHHGGLRPGGHDVEITAEMQILLGMRATRTGPLRVLRHEGAAQSYTRAKHSCIFGEKGSQVQPGMVAHNFIPVEAGESL